MDTDEPLDEAVRRLEADLNELRNVISTSNQAIAEAQKIIDKERREKELIKSQLDGGRIARRLPDYMEQQPNVTADKRAERVHKMIYKQAKVDGDDEFLHLAARLFDVYLSEKLVANDRELELLSLAALYISAKHQTVNNPSTTKVVPELAEFSFGCEVAELERAVERMLAVVAFDLATPLAITHLRRYAMLHTVDEKTLALARHLLDECLPYYEFVSASKSKLAAGVLLLAHKMRDRSAEWTQAMRSYFGHSAEEIDAWVAELNHMMTLRHLKIGFNSRLRFGAERYFFGGNYLRTDKLLLFDHYPVERSLSCPN